MNCAIYTHRTFITQSDETKRNFKNFAEKDLGDLRSIYCVSCVCLALRLYRFLLIACTFFLYR